MMTIRQSLLSISDKSCIDVGLIPTLLTSNSVRRPSFVSAISTIFIMSSPRPTPDLQLHLELAVQLARNKGVPVVCCVKQETQGQCSVRIQVEPPRKTTSRTAACRTVGLIHKGNIAHGTDEREKTTCQKPRSMQEPVAPQVTWNSPSKIEPTRKIET